MNKASLILSLDLSSCNVINANNRCDYFPLFSIFNSSELVLPIRDRRKLSKIYFEMFMTWDFIFYLKNKPYLIESHKKHILRLAREIKWKMYNKYYASYSGGIVLHSPQGNPKCPWLDIPPLNNESRTNLLRTPWGGNIKFIIALNKRNHMDIFYTIQYELLRKFSSPFDY